MFKVRPPPTDAFRAAVKVVIIYIISKSSTGPRYEIACSAIMVPMIGHIILILNMFQPSSALASYQYEYRVCICIYWARDYFNGTSLFGFFRTLLLTVETTADSLARFFGNFFHSRSAPLHYSPRLSALQCKRCTDVWRKYLLNFFFGHEWRS